MKPIRSASRGFTLVELLVVIMIVLVLAVLAFTGARRFIENAKKTQAMAQFRDLKVGLTMLEVDYGKPPIPSNKRAGGWDTIYGDPGGYYENGYIIATLSGEEGEFNY
ncbi:MAG: prepilin-type N-terminal cleavage/methylation domain-containing protein, partial [Akkermansiaceae bacterium]|nr:prepilin-type N-terminal cleavage/methylation domain-containing protein [Akkermansiaceae bacterium]